jgi:hypothetical protein
MPGLLLRQKFNHKAIKGRKNKNTKKRARREEKIGRLPL